MQRRELGKSGLEIAPLVFGGNVFGWTADEPTSFNILDAFVEAGFDAIDTANSYSRWVPGHLGGESEIILGKWMKSRGNRGKVVIATKVGSEVGLGDAGLSKAQILKQAEASLRRLQTDRIDLYQSHWDDLKTRLEESLGAYGELIKQGKVRTIGASNFTAERLAESLEVSGKNQLPSYVSLQPHYNLCERADYEWHLEPLCREKNLGVIPYFSLAAGFLTGKYRPGADLSKSSRADRVSKYMNDKGWRILGALDDVARDYNSKPACVALAWLLSRPSVTAPIASATSLEQLQDLIAATRLELDESALEKLNHASSEN